jgi:hypothetical protein
MRSDIMYESIIVQYFGHYEQIVSSLRKSFFFAYVTQSFFKYFSVCECSSC